MFTQVPPQRALRGRVQSVPHAKPVGEPEEITQTDVGSVHPLVQLPQRNDVFTEVSQPVEGLPEQLSLPAKHARDTLHWPPSQVTRERSTPGNEVQSLPQRPQLRGSVSEST